MHMEEGTNYLTRMKGIVLIEDRDRDILSPSTGYQDDRCGSECVSAMMFKIQWLFFSAFEISCSSRGKTTIDSCESTVAGSVVSPCQSVCLSELCSGAGEFPTLSSQTASSLLASGTANWMSTCLSSPVTVGNVALRVCGWRYGPEMSHWETTRGKFTNIRAAKACHWLKSIQHRLHNIISTESTLYTIHSFLKAFSEIMERPFMMQFFKNTLAAIQSTSIYLGTIGMNVCQCPHPQGRLSYWAMLASVSVVNTVL